MAGRSPKKDIRFEYKPQVDRIAATAACFVERTKMTDICQDKTSPYDIRQSDSDLIDAAKSLGHWLSSHSVCSEKQWQAITAMLLFLDNLPAPPAPDFNAEFGFSIEADCPSKETPLYRDWNVSVCRSLFEIGSVYTDIIVDFGNDEGEYEFTWRLCPGQPNRNDDFNRARWIAEVGSPAVLVGEGYRLVIEALTWQVVN